MSGKLLARGRIRVDARRAISKLREHMLVDLALYAAEIARGAAAGGASFLSIRYDANDVEFAFDGSAFDADHLARLLDYVLGEATSAEEQRMKRCALGVNAALGLGPAYVDVYTRRGSGALRVRYEPGLLKEDSVATPNAEQLAAPEQLAQAPSAAQNLFHLRRRIGLDVMRRALTREQPREIALLLELCREFSLPITVNANLHPVPASAALLSTQLDLGGVRRAWLELHPAGTRGSCEFLEWGVLLVRYGFALGEDFPSEPHEGLGIPARLVVDAKALPTNASRSDLREDSELMARVPSALTRAFLRLLDGLIAVTGGQSPPQGVSLHSQDPAALSDALGAIACVVGGAARQGRALGAAAQRVLELPLLTDALGRRRALAEFIGQPRIWALTQDGPLPERLAPWMANVLWLRGSIAERALSPAEFVDATELLERAEYSAERRQRHLAHTPSEPLLGESQLTLISERFEHDSGPLMGLKGEVALLLRSPKNPVPSRVRVYIEGRHLGTLSLDNAEVPLSFEAAIAWEGMLVPTFDYDGVAASPLLELARSAVIRHAVELSCKLLERATALDSTERDPLHLVLRAALASVAAAGLEPPAVDAENYEQPDNDEPENAGQPRASDEPPCSSAIGRLRDANIWPTTEPGRSVSLSMLAGYAKRTGAICHAAADARRGKAADGRPVVSLDAEELGWLVRALGSPVALVPYDLALPPPTLQERQRLLSSLLTSRQLGRSLPSMAHRGLGERCAEISIADKPELVEVHLGRPLSVLPIKPHYGNVLVAIDDPRNVPNASWDQTLWSNSRYTGALEQQLLERVISALKGNEKHARELSFEPSGPDGQLAPELFVYLADSLLALRQRYQTLGKVAAHTGHYQALQQVLDEFERLEFLVWLDSDGRASGTSPRELEQFHQPPNKIPLLEYAPGFATLDWRPVILVSAAEQQAFERLTQRSFLAHGEVPFHKQLAAAEMRRQEVVDGPQLDLSSVEGAGSESVIAHVTSTAESSAGLPESVQSVALALASNPRDLELGCDVLYERSRVVRLPSVSVGYEVLARVSFNTPYAFDAWKELSDVGLRDLRTAITAALPDLARAVVGAAESAEASAQLLFNPAAIGLLKHVKLAGKAKGLLDAAVLPTVQGGERALGECHRDSGALWIGRERYASWNAGDAEPSPFDQPILHLPRTPTGDAFAGLLEAGGFTLMDVSAALRRLQAERAGDRVLPPPTLAGRPEWPELRCALDSGLIRGELELYDAAESEVVLIDPFDAEHPLKLELPLPARARLRVEFEFGGAELPEPIRANIVLAVEELVANLLPRLDEQPEWLRAQCLNWFCRRLTAGSELRSEEYQAAVLPDLLGAHHAVSSLQGRKTKFTTLPPPYPDHRTRHPILRLSEAQAQALGGLAELKNADKEVRRASAAHERATAPPVVVLRLPPEERGRCIACFDVQSAELEGEVGLLYEAHESNRGVRVHTKRRALGTIPDGHGWPLYAVINDDRVEPNRWFEAPRTKSSVVRLLSELRPLADGALRSLCRAPADALATHFVADAPIGDGIRASGSIWLPAAWPQRPRVEVLLPHQVTAASRALAASEPPPNMAALLPVEGKLMIRNLDHDSAGRVWPVLAKYVERHLPDLLAAARSAHPGAEALRQYSFDLALLQPVAGGEGGISAADGQSISATRVRQELSERGELWLSDRAGHVEGEFPGRAPGFVLLDERSPELGVLRERITPDKLRQLGGLPRQAPATLVADLALVQPTAAARPEPSHGMQAAPQLCRRLFDQLAMLDLDGRPLNGVRVVESRRAVRFDAGSGQLELGRGNATIQRLLALGELGPSHVVSLSAAALNEINRALRQVTDAEEHRCLMTLLQTF